MKRLLKAALAVLCAVCVSFPAVVAAAEEEADSPLELNAKAAVLMEGQSGQILYHKRLDERLYPASITKILTAIIAIESGKLDEMVTVSRRAATVGGTRVYLEEGEQKSLENLVYALMINSGNDAAVAIAEHVGGSVEQFARMMNEKARAIGATHSHFVNPSGMPDDAHVTTARDMALITRYAMRNGTFRQIVGAKEFPWTGAGWQPGKITNHNRLLWDYRGATGVKNGYTKEAQYTFVATAERNGQQLIAVVLNVPGPQKNVYRDLKQLLDYGFHTFDTYRLTLASDRYETTVAGRDVLGVVQKGERFVTVPKSGRSDVKQTPVFDEDLTLPVRAGETIGHVDVALDGKTLQKIPIVATKDVALTSHFNEQTESFRFPWIGWVLSIVVFTLSFLYLRTVRRINRERRIQAKFRSYRG